MDRRLYCYHFAPCGECDADKSFPLTEEECEFCIGQEGHPHDAHSVVSFLTYASKLNQELFGQKDIVYPSQHREEEINYFNAHGVHRYPS